MDENPVDPAINEPAVEDNSPTTSPVDEPTTSAEPETEGAVEPAQIDEPTAEAPDSEPERKPTRAERRIRDLVDENKRLSQQSNQPFAGFQPPPVPTLNPGEEISQEDYQAHVVQAADAIAGLQTQQQIQNLKAEMQLERDVEVLPKEYPQLDENSSEYNSVLVEKIEKAYKERAFRNGRVDPTVRLADVAKDFVEVAQSAANKSSADMKLAVARTADESALPPNSSVKADKPFNEKSIEEMEAELGYGPR